MSLMIYVVGAVAVAFAEGHEGSGVVSAAAAVAVAAEISASHEGVNDPVAWALARRTVVAAAVAGAWPAGRVGARMAVGSEQAVVVAAVASGGGHEVLVLMLGLLKALAHATIGRVLRWPLSLAEPVVDAMRMEVALDVGLAAGAGAGAGVEVDVGAEVGAAVAVAEAGGGGVDRGFGVGGVMPGHGDLSSFHPRHHQSSWRR